MLRNCKTISLSVLAIVAFAVALAAAGVGFWPARRRRRKPWLRTCVPRLASYRALPDCNADVTG